MFSYAIVRTPCQNMVQGITSAALGAPDYDLALKQHLNYIQALEHCGLKVAVMPPDESFPDSVFIEDTAVLTPKCAIISNPGAKSRNREVEKVIPEIKKFYSNMEFIKLPGTLDGGDVMMCGTHFYAGLSDRTNTEGAKQFITILEKYGLSGESVPMSEMLHLKTGVNYLEDKTILTAGEFIDHPVFNDFRQLVVSEDEAYAANSLWINGTVIVPEGFPKTLAMIEDAGYTPLTVDTSEFRKLDGGLSCLSLRF